MHIRVISYMKGICPVLFVRVYEYKNKCYMCRIYPVLRGSKGTIKINVAYNRMKKNM